MLFIIFLWFRLCLMDHDEFEPSWMDEKKYEVSREGEIEMIVRNKKIREEAKKYRVPLWMVADAVGMADSNFSRKLRHELPEDEQEKIINCIHQIAVTEN